MKKILLFTLITITIFLSGCEGLIDNNPIECGANEELLDGECQLIEPTCESDELLVDGECELVVPTCEINEELINNECIIKTPTCGEYEKVYDVYEGNDLVDKVCGFDTSICIDYVVPTFDNSEQHLGYDISLLQTENDTVQTSSEIIEYLNTYKSLIYSDLYYGDNPLDEYEDYYSTYTEGDYTSHEDDAHLYLYRDDILDYDFFDIINYDYGSSYRRIDLLFQMLDLVVEENPTIQEETAYSVDEISLYTREEDRVVDVSLYVEDDFLYVYIDYLEIDFLNSEYTETSTYRLYIDDSGTMLVDFITIEKEYGYDVLECGIKIQENIID